jgi:acyl-CoA reductase-like NAD-dependent aldehyde dehydrogenase
MIVVSQLVHDVGFPPGVFNSVTGDGRAAGKPLAESPGIDMVSFTGSIPTGSASEFTPHAQLS